MNNKKLSIFVLAGIVVLSSVAATIMLDEANNTTLVIAPLDTQQTISQPEIHGEPEDVSKPSEYEFWTGVPILESFPGSLDRDDQIELKLTEYDWLQRVVENGVTIVDKNDLREFEALTEQNGNYFKVGNEFYSIYYSTAKVNLENNYVRAVHLDNEDPNSRVSESNLLSKTLEDPYNWFEISDVEANEYLALKTDGKHFKTPQGDIQLQYLGTHSPESNLEKYQSIVDRSAGKTGEENEP
ncbi:hypothetical protein [Nitrosopumilus sp. b2]|uniref:hypothetical protein n=1 Tax=Nitrosopumilus sp. b2 TaxID=2109908 RepID=UPI0015F39C6B|nr:hypothetical protein [Nitrosopumilus sp. b2]